MNVRDAEINMKIKFSDSLHDLEDSTIGWIVGFTENSLGEIVLITRWSKRPDQDRLVHPGNVSPY